MKDALEMLYEGMRKHGYMASYEKYLEEFEAGGLEKQLMKIGLFANTPIDSRPREPGLDEGEGEI